MTQPYAVFENCYYKDDMWSSTALIVGKVIESTHEEYKVDQTKKGSFLHLNYILYAKKNKNGHIVLFTKDAHFVIKSISRTEGQHRTELFQKTLKRLLRNGESR